MVEGVPLLGFLTFEMDGANQFHLERMACHLQDKQYHPMIEWADCGLAALACWLIPNLGCI
jgi:hypothetical protein